MQPERAERIAEIVEQMLEADVAQRPELIADLSGEDCELRAEVESLLQFHDKAKDFIEAPAYKYAAEIIADDAGELKAGQILGDYKIVSLVGEGGMGEVYLAEDTSLGRKVAIKVLKFGLGTSDIVRRFHQEERILAGLTHPNIARLYGGAVTSAGLPYFVMEYVDGQRLDDYCRDHELSVKERLELFRKICGAVSYAHQRLVIHRDLKQANIRVTSEGEPKLLDFGIAKLLDPESAIELTMTFAAVMTPDYASPEQIRGENITTASDVYSLGVVLYELLTGKKPYKVDGRTPVNVGRAITEQEPTRPSAVNAKGEGNGKTRLTNPKLLRGDLDNVVMKALRKEPERRYASVGQFSEDIRRHLEGRPVIARRDTFNYRASKFIARNRIAVSAGALVLFAIVAGLIVSLWEAQNARQQRDLAEREKLKAQRINTFLQDMLGAAAPEVKGIDIKVSDVLDEASARAVREATDQPAVMADVLMTMGRTYLSLSKADKAEANLRAGLRASFKANGELNATTATTMGWLGLALAYQNKTAEGEQISRKAVQLQRRLHPQGHEDLGVALYALGYNLIGRNELKEAKPVLQEASVLIRKHLGETHGYYIATLVALAGAYHAPVELDASEALYRQAIAVGARVEPRYRIFLAQAQSSLGFLLIRKGVYPEAEKLLLQSEATYHDVNGGDGNPSVGMVKANLGLLYFVQGNYAKAEEEDRKALDILRINPGPEHPLTASTEATLGLTLTREGKAGEGEPLLRRALAVREKVLPPGDFMTPYAESALGECVMAQKRYEEAEPLLAHSYNDLKSKLNEKDFHVIEARERLIKLYATWGKPDQAE
jgi:serine/threonine-protein kinase